jgi:hypothetical protein
VCAYLGGDDLGRRVRVGNKLKNEKQGPDVAWQWIIPTEIQVFALVQIYFRSPRMSRLSMKHVFRMTVSMRNGRMKKRLLVAVGERSHGVIMDEISLRTSLQASWYIQRASEARGRGR